MIREAIQYVDPGAHKEEVIDPKSKAAKGKAPVEQPLDPFAGMDTKVYKESAMKILEKIKKVFGDKLPGKEVDLVELVGEDCHVVEVLVQKMKFTLKPPLSLEQ